MDIDQYCIRPSALLGLGQWVQISTVLGLQLCQGQDNGCGSVLYQAFSYARARTMGVDQYCIRPSAMLGLGQWVQISTVLGLQLCQGQDNGCRSVLYQAFSYARARSMGVDQYCIRPSAMLGLGQWVQISTVLGLQLCQGQVNGCRSVLYQAFSSARARTMGIDQYCIRPSAMLGLGQWVQISTVLGLQLCQGQDNGCRSVLYQAFSYARARSMGVDQYCIRPSALLGLGQWVQISTVLGLQLCQGQDNGYRSVLYQAFSYARARTMGIDQYCIRPSAMLGLGQWVQISTVLGLQLCQGQDNGCRSVLYQAFSYARARTMGVDQYCIRPSAMLGLGQWVQISTVLGLQLCQGQDNGCRSVLYQAFSYARARTMGIDQYCIRPSAMLGLGQWVQISTVLGLQLCQGQDNGCRSVLYQAFSYARVRSMGVDQYCIRPSALLGLGQWVQISTVLGLQLCWGQDNGYRSVLYQAFSYAGARTMGIDQYCIRPSAMLGLGQWVQISTVLGLQLCQGQDNGCRSVLYQAFSYARARSMGRAIQSNNARISSFAPYGIRLKQFI